MTTLLSFNNDKKLKDMILKEVENHRKQDQIIKGTYAREEKGKWKGCAVGCSIHSLNIKLGKDYSTSDHSVYEKELGLPEWLARLEDTIFEGLPVLEAKKWPSLFLKTIPVGVNLEPIKWKFCAFILKENIDRVLKLKIEDSLKEQVVKAIQSVLSLHENAIETGKWNESAAWSAESAAWSAESAVRSAESAAWSAERSAEWSAAWSAESAARSAAWSAESAARSAAWSAAWSAESAARSAESAAWSAESAAWSAAWSAARSAAWSAAWSAERSAAWSAESAARSAAWSAEWSAESAAYKKYAKELLRLIEECK